MIYSIVFNNDARRYIGSTQKPFIEERYAKHILDCYSKKANNKLYNFMRQFPPSNFKIVILKTLDSACSRSDLRREEEYYINLYDSINNGFNINRAFVTQEESKANKLKIFNNFKLKHPNYFKDYYLKNKTIKYKIPLIKNY
jgi:hypothetical protein